MNMVPWFHLRLRWRERERSVVLRPPSVVCCRGLSIPLECLIEECLIEEVKMEVWLLYVLAGDWRRFHGDYTCTLAHLLTCSLAHLHTCTSLISSNRDSSVLSSLS